MEHGCRRREAALGAGRRPEELLQFVGLEEFADENASAMPFGNLRRLGIAVALGGRPSQLLLENRRRGSMKAKASVSFSSSALSTSLASASASSTTTFR